MAQARGDRRRAELLEAALAVVGRDGLAALSHRRVAAEAGVPFGSMTYYFASKRELVAETLRAAAEGELRALEQRTRELEEELSSDDELVEQIAGWLDAQLRGAARTRLVALYSLQLEAMRSPELRTIYAEWTAATVALARRLLQAAGVPAPDEAAPVLVAALDGLRHNQLASGATGLPRSARGLVARVVTASRAVAVR